MTWRVQCANCLYSCSTGKLAMAGFFDLTDKKTRSIIWTGILKVESLFSWDESGKGEQT
ncbi:MAG: hypothetical protein PHS94_07880 [Erysipelotrichaceae bacterium]|nr:hypothetical protein [Erysipelotrichaceae bacterium]